MSLYHIVEKRGDVVAAAAVAVSLLAVTYLHYSTMPGLRELHAVYRYFYFLPIVYSALRFGFWGGVISALAASLLFAPHILFKWGNFAEDSLNDLLAVVVFYSVAVVTGITVDRLRAVQAQQRGTAEKLAASLEQLERQGEELRRAEHLSALGTLAGGLAHEIRNPVSIIRATAQLMAMEGGPEAAESIAVIQKETDRVEGFVQELLNYAGEDLPNRKSTDVRVLVDHLVRRLDPLLESHGVALSVTAADPLPMVWVDGDQLEQALLNLCINGIQALNGRGQIHLEVAVCGRTLTIAVEDSGPGIDAEDRVRIFDPFYTTKDTGAGLGLSVVQRIVQNHDGQIRVESAPGRGARFTVLLPLQEGTEDGKRRTIDEGRRMNHV